MGDFLAIERLFRQVLGELSSRGFLAVRPKVLIHLMPEAPGGYTNVEERAFQEAAESAGARNTKIVSSRPSLSDNQVLEALR
jgi:actin-like ATPase involved in cell morphogenesis